VIKWRSRVGEAPSTLFLESTAAGSGATAAATPPLLVYVALPPSVGAAPKDARALRIHFFLLPTAFAEDAIADAPRVASASGPAPWAPATASLVWAANVVAAGATSVTFYQTSAAVKCDTHALDALERAARRRQRLLPSASDVAAAFARFDTSRRGWLDRSEALAAVMALLPRVDARGLLSIALAGVRRSDGDGDGSIGSGDKRHRGAAPPYRCSRDGLSDMLNDAVEWHTTTSHTASSDDDERADEQ
jgi:hypothetical protein